MKRAGKPSQLVAVARRCRSIIRRADNAGLVINDGNVVDLCADNLPSRVSLNDIRDALVTAGLSARFPRATRRHNPIRPLKRKSRGKPTPRRYRQNIGRKKNGQFTGKNKRARIKNPVRIRTARGGTREYRIYIHPSNAKRQLLVKTNDIKYVLRECKRLKRSGVRCSATMVV